MPDEPVRFRMAKAKNCKSGSVYAVDADNETQSWCLKVSPTAIKAFDSYVTSVARSFQLPPLGVVTEPCFDDGVTYASALQNPRPNEEHRELAFCPPR